MHSAQRRMHNEELSLCIVHFAFAIELTVAWAVPASHRTSSASLPNKIVHCSLIVVRCFYSLQRSTNHERRSKHICHSHIPARRIAVEHHIYGKDITNVLSRQDIGRCAFRGHRAVL